MYLPAKFAVDATIAPDFIRSYPFATLIAFDGAEPLINHLPLNYEDHALWGHMAFTNSSWKAMKDQKVTAVFHGPHAYVDHRYYVEPRMEVPTWNYAVVHVSGVLRTLHDRNELISALDRLQKAMRPAESWANNTPPDLAREGVLEKSIVGLKIDINDIQVKFKLSQNKSTENQDRVMEALENSLNSEDQATAKLMHQYYAR